MASSAKHELVQVILEQVDRLTSMGAAPFLDESIVNFTPRAQQALALARFEAIRINHNFIGTEHLLLGLIKLGQGVAFNVLLKMGLDFEAVRMAVEKEAITSPSQDVSANIASRHE